MQQEQTIEQPKKHQKGLYQMKKASIYKWRENNKSKFNAYQRIAQKNYDNWRRIKTIYLNILLEQ